LNYARIDIKYSQTSPQWPPQGKRKAAVAGTEVAIMER